MYRSCQFWLKAIIKVPQTLNPTTVFRVQEPCEPAPYSQLLSSSLKVPLSWLVRQQDSKLQRFPQPLFALSAKSPFGRPEETLPRIISAPNFTQQAPNTPLVSPSDPKWSLMCQAASLVRPFILLHLLLYHYCSDVTYRANMTANSNSCAVVVHLFSF